MTYQILENPPLSAVHVHGALGLISKEDRLQAYELGAGEFKTFINQLNKHAKKVIDYRITYLNSQRWIRTMSGVKKDDCPDVKNENKELQNLREISKTLFGK